MNWLSISWASQYRAQDEGYTTSKNLMDDLLHLLARLIRPADTHC